MRNICFWPVPDLCKNEIDAVQALNDGSSPYVCDEYTAACSDWRMPNMLELTSMVDWSEWYYAFPTSPFIWSLGGYLWTSTSTGWPWDPLTYAWVIESADGKSWYYEKVNVSPFSVWPVRTPGDTGVEITGIWPASAEIGEHVSVFIFGDNFTTDNTTEVYFNGVRQWIVAPVTTDMLIVRIYVTADLFGLVTVTTPSGSTTSTQEFGLPLTGLNLTGIWPSDPKIGEWESIFLFGTEFTTDGSTEVYFNGVRQFMVAPVTSEMLIVRVLGDASLSGTVTVTTPSGTVNSSEPLTFVP